MTDADSPAEHRDYPTLTDAERASVHVYDAEIAILQGKIHALQEKVAEARTKRTEVLEAAAARATTLAEVTAAYTTTGVGYAALRDATKALHPYIGEVVPFGEPGERPVLAPLLRLTGDRNAAEEVEPLAEALCTFARDAAPGGGLTSEKDIQWAAHAQGMHPVDVHEDDLSRTRTLLLGHTADGAKAALLDQRHGYRYGPDGVVATGTLVEVLAELLRIAREEKPRADEGY